MAHKLVEELHQKFLRSHGLDMEQSPLVGTDELLVAVEQDTALGQMRPPAAAWKGADSTNLEAQEESRRLDEMLERASTRRSPFHIWETEEGSEPTVQPKREQCFYAPLEKERSPSATVERQVAGLLWERLWVPEVRERMVREHEQTVQTMLQLLQRQDRDGRTGQVQTAEPITVGLEFQVQKQQFPTYEKDADIQIYLNLFEYVVRIRGSQKISSEGS